ncbi:MAG: serine/threonine protein kinase [Planctomycetes bacterium]|nr:serine/threonine protein kinase [Planctomycetota bacterium]
MTPDHDNVPLDDGMTDSLRRAFLCEVGFESGRGEGRVIGQYLLLAPIGQGANGTVWRALHRELLHEVAVKTLDRIENGDPERLERFRREAATAARLRHPGIARVHDFGCEDATWYLAMDLVDGRRLDDWIEQEQPPLARRLELLERVARAVDYAHRQGVIHRDLKPSNIVVRADGEPVLVDFGVARTHDDRLRTLDGVVTGTLAFMAPEQLRGAAEQDARADVFALGVLLHWLATGTFRFGDARTPAEALAARCAVPPPDRSDDPLGGPLSGAIDALVRRCLEPDVARRLPNAATLADDLGRLQRGEPIDDGATSWPRRAWRKLIGRGRRAAGIIVVGAALVALAYTGWRALDRDETVTRQRRLLAIATAQVEISARVRGLLEQAERMRYELAPEADRQRLLAEIEVRLDGSADNLGVADAYRGWSCFLLDPKRAAETFERAKQHHSDNPFVWLMSARRQLRRVAESPAWSPSLPIRPLLLFEPIAIASVLHPEGALRQVLADARDDLDRARATARVEEQPRMAWIGQLCEGMERFAAGDLDGVIERLSSIADHTKVDFEATLFLCLALCERQRPAEAVERARALFEGRSGFTPAGKLLALCLQAQACAAMADGGSPIDPLVEAKERFAQARGDSLVDDILAATVEFDLSCARAAAQTASIAEWTANVAAWWSIRDRIAAQSTIDDATLRAAETRVELAEAQLWLSEEATREPEATAEALDESAKRLERAAAQCRSARALAPQLTAILDCELECTLRALIARGATAARFAATAGALPLAKLGGDRAALGRFVDPLFHYARESRCPDAAALLDLLWATVANASAIRPCAAGLDALAADIVAARVAINLDAAGH